MSARYFSALWFGCPKLQLSKAKATVNVQHFKVRFYLYISANLI